MAEKIIHLASGIKIWVEVGGAVHGFRAGDIITADERHCKWTGKEVIVEGFAGGVQGKPKVIWGRVATEDTCDCAHNPEGLILVSCASDPTV